MAVKEAHNNVSDGQEMPPSPKLSVGSPKHEENSVV
jgi:hypothetical protein